jgi:hypothetical protein
LIAGVPDLVQAVGGSLPVYPGCLRSVSDERAKLISEPKNRLLELGNGRLKLGGVHLADLQITKLEASSMPPRE